MFGLSRKQAYMIESGTYRIARYVDSPPSTHIIDHGVSVIAFEDRGYLVEEQIIVRRISKKLASVTYLNWGLGKPDMIRLPHDEIMNTFSTFEFVEQIR